MLKAIVASSSYGSIDLLLFDAHLAKLTRDGPIALYRDGIETEWCGHEGQKECLPFNHPPFMIHVLKAWAGMSDVSGVPLRFWLRFTCALADAGSLVVMLAMVRGWRDDPDKRIALCLFAASPIAVLVSGYHGNTDPIMLFFVLLSVWMIEQRWSAWLCGAALGVAASVKILPLALCPVLLWSIEGSRRKVSFIAATALALVIGSLPMLLIEPTLIATRVLGYRPPSGTWGLPLVALITQLGVSTSVYDTYMRYAKAVTLTLIASASLVPRPRGTEHGLLLRIGLIMSLVVWSAPGWGIQYLVWLVPWVVVLGAGATAIYYLVGTVYLMTYYGVASGQLGSLPAVLNGPLWTPTTLTVGLICWLVVSWLTFVYARRLIAVGARAPDARQQCP